MRLPRFQSPNPRISEYAFTNDFEKLDHLSVLQGRALFGVPGEHHQNTFDADISEQLDLDLSSDNHTAVFPTPLPLDHGATARSLSLKLHEIPSPFTMSCSSDSSGAVVDQLSAKPQSPLQVVQYNHTETQKKSEAKRNRIAKPRAKAPKSRALALRSDVLKTDTVPKISVKRDVNGKIAGTLTVFGLGSVVRAPISSELQLATSITRRIGACLRCQTRRQRCDMPENVYEPCGHCMRLIANFRMRHTVSSRFQPCIRISLLDLRLHRKGPTIYDDLHIWVEGKQELLKYQEVDSTQLLWLTQGFGEGFENTLCLIVSRFEPGPGDRTAYFWTDSSGQRRSMKMPPYFISNVVAARRSICEFLRSVRSVYIETLLADSNSIIRKTFQAALVYNAFGQRKLISDALDIWVAARFIESHWHVICGGPTMGVQPTDELGHPYDGFIPVTPIMDTQLDDLVIRDLLVPLTNQFLKRLKAKIDERKPEDWLEIHLAMFVMMSNIGWIIKDMIAMTSWKGLKPGSRGGTLTQGYMHACKTMLSYFHFACAGPIPFITFDKHGGSDRKTDEWTADQIAYDEYLQQEIAHQEAKISKWKELVMYEDDGYWCYQMLCKDWQGDIPHAGEIDDFTEDDFLSSSGT